MRYVWRRYSCPPSIFKMNSCSPFFRVLWYVQVAWGRKNFFQLTGS